MNTTTSETDLLRNVTDTIRQADADIRRAIVTAHLAGHSANAIAGATAHQVTDGAGYSRPVLLEILEQEAVMALATEALAETGIEVGAGGDVHLYRTHHRTICLHLPGPFYERHGFLDSLTDEQRRTYREREIEALFSSPFAQHAFLRAERAYGATALTTFDDRIALADRVLAPLAATGVIVGSSEPDETPCAHVRYKLAHGCDEVLLLGRRGARVWQERRAARGVTGVGSDPDAG